MSQRSSIVLDMADTLPNLEEIFVENKTAINKDAVTAAMLYLFAVPSYTSPKFGVSEKVAVDFYKKFEKLEPVQISAVLKAIELECMANIDQYTPPLKKELNKAVLAIRDVEKTYDIRLTDFCQ